MSSFLRSKHMCLIDCFTNIRRKMFACCIVAYDILNMLQMTCPEEHPKLLVFSAGVYCYNTS